MNDRRAHRVRGASPELDLAARQLRRRMTRAETVLWNALRRHQLDGLHFRRQHPLGRFVLDFYCAAAKLVIEVDGEIHNSQPERDLERTGVLEASGYRVIRFSNDEVIGKLPLVLERIRSAVRENVQEQSRIRDLRSPPTKLGEGPGEGDNAVPSYNPNQ